MEETKKYKCPRDNSKLEYGNYCGVNFHRCPKCQGVLILQKLIYSLLDIMTKKLQQTITFDCPLEKIVDKGEGILCPICNKEMENYGYMESRFVMIDACHTCKVVWMDTNELGAMCVQFARTQKRLNYAHLQEERRIIESLRLSDSLAVAKIVENHLLYGFVIGKIL